MKLFDLDQALLDPASVFDSPEELAGRSDVERKDKIEILRRWEYDASGAAVAEEEGMPDGDEDLVSRVASALTRLTGGYNPGFSPPTKHGGIPRRAFVWDD